MIFRKWSVVECRDPGSNTARSVLEINMTLIERLEQATGPDTLLDDDLHWHFSDWRNLGGYWREHKVTGEQQCFTYVRAPAYTADLNAALALVEEKLPKVTWRMGSGVPGLTEPWFRIGESPAYDGHAPTPALAVLIALLKAIGEDQ